jgi:hypothetical protein
MGFSAFFIIEHAGTIRHKWIGKPGKDSSGTALVKLINEAESN